MAITLDQLIEKFKYPVLTSDEIRALEDNSLN